MNGLEITTENCEAAKFSIPYYVYTQSIVVLKSNTTINTFADLAGKTVETGTDYKAQFIMEDWNAKNPERQIQIVTTDTPTPFADLDSQRVDAKFLDTPIAKWYGANDPSGKYKIVGGDLNPGYYGIAFSLNQPQYPDADSRSQRGDLGYVAQRHAEEDLPGWRRLLTSTPTEQPL